jgi:hypothetical protein
MNLTALLLSLLIPLSQLHRGKKGTQERDEVEEGFPSSSKKSGE